MWSIIEQKNRKKNNTRMTCGIQKKLTSKTIKTDATNQTTTIKITK